MSKAHKRADFSGALGAILGGIGGAAQTTPNAAAAGSATSTDPAFLARAGTMNSSLATNGNTLTPELLASIGIQKPGAFSNFLTGGRAQANYQSAVAPLVEQQMRGQTDLAKQGMIGSQEQQNISATGGQERQTAAQNAAISWMNAHDIPFTPENFQKAQSAMMDKSLAASLTGKQVQQNQATAMAKATTGKTYQGAVDTGAANEAAAPMFANLSKTPTVGMGQQVYAPLPGADYRASGAMPTGSTSTHTTSIDARTGMPTSTEKTQQGFNPPSASMLPKIDLDSISNQFQQGGNGQSVTQQPDTSSAPVAPPTPFGLDMNKIMGINQPASAPQQSPISPDMIQKLQAMLGANSQFSGQPLPQY